MRIQYALRNSQLNNRPSCMFLMGGLAGAS